MGSSLTKEAGLLPFRPEAGGEPRYGMAGMEMLLSVPRGWGCALTHQGDAECPSSASWETCTGSVWARGSMEEHNQFTVDSHL